MRPRVIRLERLKDKADRYSSHISFLKECKDTKVIPKGLKIDLEPSIGNHDEEFTSLWFRRLEDFSMILISDIINLCERIENETTVKIDEELADLKGKMHADDYKRSTDKMTYNSEQRRKRLSMTKRKKYHHLRYNRPERQDTKRPTRPKRQGNPRNTFRPKRRQGNPRPSYRDTDWDTSDEELQRRTQRNTNCNRDTATHSRDQYGDDSDHHQHDYQDEGSRRRNHQVRDDHQDPRPSYRDALTRSHPNSRGNSFTSLPQRRSNHSLSRGNSRQNLRDTRPRDSYEPNRTTTTRTNHEELRQPNRRDQQFTDAARNRGYDNGHRRDQQQRPTATTIEQDSPTTTGTGSSPKNGDRPGEGPTQKKATQQEMMSFIEATMQSLELFKRQLIN